MLPMEKILSEVSNKFVELWESQAGLKTFAQAVADAMEFHIDEGQHFDLTVDQWLAWSSTVGHREARERSRRMGLNVVWDCELGRTPEGYYPVRGGIEYAIAKSLAVAPFCDLIWMETKTANLADAKQFADAIHAVYPDQMLAYKKSPPSRWYPN